MFLFIRCADNVVGEENESLRRNQFENFKVTEHERGSELINQVYEKQSRKRICRRDAVVEKLAFVCHLSLCPRFGDGVVKNLIIMQKRFLVADTQLFKRLCPSICPSVGPSVRPR